ncbi:SDR family oxidoreductase [Nonomuraea rhodomycinica]|uniref:NAD(P)H-binding protein n=1 Tax=Nonomuraea rhodomycinica TaxID=1712872 RepID=A0A7Y6IJJ9_9ACTN|nr:NAD(P)H-binding protein [Nonomuraea rhodomycinica]NUW39201.1 NAD(P)H-binding protein [Nonomuraea rhodomycinica]
MIVVFGGTGRVGRQIVDRLRREGKAVRVVTRDPTSARAGEDVEVVAGDLRERNTLVRAVAGAEAVVCTVQGGDGKGIDGPRRIEGAGIPRLIGVARDAAVGNFVYISSASARPDSPVEFFRLKFEAERVLRASGLPYSILRPTHLMDTWVETLAESIVTKGKATVLGSGASPVSWVAGEDVAKVAAAIAARPGECWSADLGGPEALPLTKVNELIAASLGVQVKGENRMPAGMLRVMSTLTRPFNEVLARRMRMGALLDTQPQVVDSGAVWAEFGEPLSFPAWLEANRPARGARSPA